ncbi:MAG: hypothetical protein PHN69_02460 [Candidatus Pacebacteria bacterium]|nr:hypothetical protein [Candidatus Paceibacterota bacterium]
MDITKLTQEELNKILADNEANQKLIKEQTKKLKESEDNTEKLSEVQKKAEAAELALYKKTLSERKGELSKWLKARNLESDSGLLEEIGKKSDSEFEIWKDGKTNDVFEAQEELTNKKAELETMVSEFDKEKEKIRKEVMGEKNKQNEEKVVPPMETTTDNEDGNDKHDSSKKAIENVKDIFKLDSKAYYNLAPGHEKRAERYLENSKIEEI